MAQLTGGEWEEEEQTTTLKMADGCLQEITYLIVLYQWLFLLHIFVNQVIILFIIQYSDSSWDCLVIYYHHCQLNTRNVMDVYLVDSSRLVANTVLWKMIISHKAKYRR